MRVLVTGADGFVAGGVIPAIAARGHEVIGTTRRTTPAGHSVVCVTDIGPKTDWMAALAGIDAVVHLAARVHVARETDADPLAAFRRVNRDGTGRLIEEAGRAGVETFLFVSSIGVVCQRSDVPVTEEMPPAPLTPYARSKLEAEQIVLDMASRMRVVIVRPPMIYGRDAPGNFGPLVRAVQRGLPLPFGAVRNRRSFAYLDNLADALARAVDDPRARGVYHVADDLGVATGEFVTMIADALGQKARLVPVPVSALRLAGRLTGARGLMDRLVDSLPIDSTRFRRDLGWQPPFSMREGLRRTFSTIS